jgi:hypothetical protein
LVVSVLLRRFGSRGRRRLVHGFVRGFVEELVFGGKRLEIAAHDFLLHLWLTLDEFGAEFGLVFRFRLGLDGGGRLRCFFSRGSAFAQFTLEGELAAIGDGECGWLVGHGERTFL